MILDDNFSLTAEENAWVLSFKRKGINPKTGKEYTASNSTYHSTLSQALSWYVSEVAKPCKDAKAILAKLDEVEKIIKSLKLTQ